MKSKRAKNVKMRGSRTHGYGSHKKHRGSGSKGGVGLAGGKKHKKNWMVANMPDRIGKHGFKSLQQRMIKRRQPCINVSDLERLAGGKKEIEFRGKVLGDGRISSPLAVKAVYFTEKARAKIEAAKGKAIDISDASKEVS